MAYRSQTNPPLLLIPKGLLGSFCKKTFSSPSPSLISCTDAFRPDFPLRQFRGQQNYSEYSEYSEYSDNSEYSENSEDSEAEDRRFESSRLDHSTSFFSAPVCLSSHCGRRNRKETVRKPALVGRHRKGSRAALVRLPIQLGQRFLHHVELRLAVALEHLRRRLV